jgi:tRNA-uridine 2-sulfurtransferase
MSEKVKAIGILSGGLDSLVAVKVLQEQDVEILGITFVTPFFGSDAGIEAGRKAGIEMLAIDISEKHFAMLKNPRYGYGSQMNPCIDCHGLMLKEAGRVMEREGGAFLFTGEVLGQRPMSQRRDSMRSVEKLSGYPGRILRPLSAKLLTPTIVEQEGLVDRNRLLDIQGRSRRRQKELAAYYGISDYPQPGGGCMLTSEGFGKRLRELLRNHPGATVQDAEIIKWGRAFTLPGKSICMVGRQLSDNQKIESLARDGDVCLRPLDYPGPTCLGISVAESAGDMETAAELVASYSDAPRDALVRVEWRHNGKSGICIAVARTRASFKDMLLT